MKKREKKKLSKKIIKNSWNFKNKKLMIIGIVILLFLLIFIYKGLKKNVLFSPDEEESYFNRLIKWSNRIFFKEEVGENQELYDESYYKETDHKDEETEEEKIYDEYQECGECKEGEECVALSTGGFGCAKKKCTTHKDCNWPFESMGTYPYPICDSSTKTCRHCKEDTEECKDRDANMPGCAFGYCVECTKHKHCENKKETPVCSGYSDSDSLNADTNNQFFKCIRCAPSPGAKAPHLGCKDQKDDQGNPTLYCYSSGVDDYYCVQCLEDKHCKSGKICDEEHKCVSDSNEEERIS